ncbi:hypothetical protein PTKIN_Ptkin11bG0159600 [Pterospermum kingtungense]
MMEGKAVIGETDMLQTMQQDALDLAAKALDFFDEFDRTYGPGWQCIVGTDFGSFVTLLRGSAAPDAEANQIAALETVKA